MGAFSSKCILSSLPSGTTRYLTQTSKLPIPGMGKVSLPNQVRYLGRGISPKPPNASPWAQTPQHSVESLSSPWVGGLGFICVGIALGKTTASAAWEANVHQPPSSSLLLSSLELSDTKVMILEYEAASEPLHISVKNVFLYRPTAQCQRPKFALSRGCGCRPSGVGVSGPLRGVRAFPSKVDLPHAFQCGTKCGANLVA